MDLFIVLGRSASSVLYGCHWCQSVTMQSALSSVALSTSFNEDKPVHVFALSIRVVRGLPLVYISLKCWRRHSICCTYFRNCECLAGLSEMWPYNAIEFCQLEHHFDQCFAVACPRLWNSIPAGLRQTDISYEQFKCLLDVSLWALRSWHIVSLQISDVVYVLTYKCD